MTMTSSFVLMVTFAMLAANYLVAAKVDADRSNICRNDRDCTIQVNATTSYQCNIGRKAECDTYEWNVVDINTLPGNEKFFYPYLSSINIDNRNHPNGHTIKALNFSFKLPHLSFGQGGVGQAVMAVLTATSSGTFYEVPVCRIFDLGSSQLISTETISHQNLTVPSDCLGLDLNPGAYTLLLTTVPTNHSLQYIITWPENEEDIDPDVWVQKLMAVAAVSRERLVHVVFQPLKDFVSLVKVELIDNHGNVKDVKVLKGETDVMFTDVDNGQYRVTLTPEGNECDSDELKCMPLSSEIFSIDQRAKPGGDFFLIVILVVAAPVVLATLVIILCMHRRKGDVTVCVKSHVSRELEGKISEQFGRFLSKCLHAKVEWTCSYSQSMSNQYIVDPKTSLIDSEVDSSVNHSDKLFESDYVIHVFYSSTLQCLLDTDRQVAARKGGCHRFSKCCQVWRRRRLRGQVLTAVFATPSPPGSVTVCKDVSSTGQVTVFNYRDGKSEPLLHTRAVSLCNAPDLVSSPHLPSLAGVFYLPGDINKLLGSLSRGGSFSSSEIDTSEHWRSVLSMLAKLDENHPFLGSFTTQPLERSQSMSFMTVTIDDDQSTTAGHKNQASLPLGQHLHQDRLSEVSLTDSYSNVSEAAKELLNKWPSLEAPHHCSGVSVLSGQCSCVSSLEVTDDYIPRDLLKEYYTSYIPLVGSDASSSLLSYRDGTIILYPPMNDEDNPSGFQIDSGRGDSIGFFQSEAGESQQFVVETTHPPCQYPHSFVSSIIPPEM